MGNLVAEDTGHLIFFFGQNEKACRDENVPSGNRKGIKLGFLNDKETVIEGLRSHSGEYALPNAVNIAFNFRVGFELELLASLAPKFSADPDFFVFARPAHRGKNVFGNLRGGAAASQKAHQQEPGASDLPGTEAFGPRGHLRIIETGPGWFNSV